jgi:hypothetical protein
MTVPVSHAVRVETRKWTLQNARMGDDQSNLLSRSSQEIHGQLERGESSIYPSDRSNTSTFPSYLGEIAGTSAKTSFCASLTGKIQHPMRKRFIRDAIYL